MESRINCLIRINSPIRPTFNIPLKRSSGRIILRQRYNSYVAYSSYVDPNLQPNREIILLQRHNLYVEYNLLRRSELTRRRRNSYVVWNLYVELSWRREEVIPKHQQDNFAPARQCTSSIQLLCRYQLAPKELNPRRQRNNFAPMGFEIPSAR